MVKEEEDDTLPRCEICHSNNDVQLGLCRWDRYVLTTRMRIKRSIPDF